ncbi:hypothetical protein OIDMADRAFT_34243 [Oidiodendron maius Zn]|uniref:Heterokaryon incompatibility domain-containing protein n=1 Tax=Oidiodendron maius (strain Zn) TaxID=913774 RepID=A0A0C3GW43_OIDMZ|nr:hypothetical protein OIDMADRAFT_34243 [Oidiodendron maius Zn]
MLRVFLPRDEDEEEEAETPSAHQTPPDSEKSTISIYEEGSGPDSENPKFSKEILEVARKVYDENRISPTKVAESVCTAPGITIESTISPPNNASSHDCIDVASERSTTPNGSRIIHRDDPDPSPKPCPAFIHPLYGSTVEYRNEKKREYSVTVRLSGLRDAAANCGFCHVLYTGVQSWRESWIHQWATFSWIKEHQPITTDELWDQLWEQQPWLIQFRDEIENRTPVDEDQIHLDITFARGHTSFTVDLQLLLRADCNDPLPSIAKLEFYTAPGAQSPWAAFGPSTHVYSNVGDPRCLDHIRTWVADCRDNHPSCGLVSQSGTPRRLLRIDLLDAPEVLGGVPKLGIHLEDTDAETTYDYVAVSHCWAISKPVQTTKDNIAVHRDAVPWNELSESLQDSVLMAFSIGFDFIWIDSLCIIQHDHADWASEAPRMGLMYRNAALVFALLGETLALGKSSKKSMQDPVHPTDPLIYCRYKMNHLAFSSSPGDGDSWFGRAWCMQERINASRILYFGGTHEELIFECNESIACECGRLDKKEQETPKLGLNKALAQAMDHDGAVSRTALWSVYIELCENYTARSLTVATDKLPAISSFMRFFAPYFDKYYAGIWRFNLICGLQWETLDTSKCSRPATYVAPSFSWASLSGPVIWYIDSNKMPSDDTHDFCIVMGISCTPESDGMGMVIDGYMKLKGWITTAQVKDKTWHRPDGRLEMCQAGASKFYMAVDTIQDWEILQAGSSVTCFDLMRDKDAEYVSGLMLLPLEGRDGHYRRIGFSAMRKNNFAQATKREIVIL